MPAIPTQPSGAVGNFALFCLDSGQASEARGLLHKALDLCRHTNDPVKIAERLGDLAVIDFDQGHWDSARELLEEAEALVSGIGPSWIKAHNTMRRGQVYLATGEREDGLGMIEAGRDMAERDRNLLA